MGKVWNYLGKGHPSSERICEDIKGFRRALNAIIKAKGKVVADMDMRSGRRARKSSRKGKCKNKLRKGRRIVSLKCDTLHADAVAAREILKTLAGEDFRKTLALSIDD